MTISFPKKPDGEQYEDLITASLKALGYFTETRLTFREGGQEVLELDVVATPCGEGGMARQLFEAKKQAPSFTDIFKLYGQRIYLGISKASLVGLKSGSPDHLPVYTAKGEELGIRICNYMLSSSIEELAQPTNTLGSRERDTVALIAWFQQIARRLCENRLLKVCKSKSGSNPYDTARTYLFNVRTSFFQPSPLARAESLYSAYFQSPKLAGDLVKAVSIETGMSEKDVWNKINDNEDWPWIQGLIQIETTARLSIIKNALDDVVERGVLPPPQTVLKVGSLSIEVPLHALPVKFHTGLDVMRNHPHGARLPYLFQVFAEVLGGFLFFNDSDELAFVEALTGIPSGDIVDSIRLLDKFFAPDGRSLFYIQKDQLLCMKMVPGIVRGGGAFLRKAVFNIEQYDDRYPDMGWLIAKWHNALYRLLVPSLSTTERE